MRVILSYAPVLELIREYLGDADLAPNWCDKESQDLLATLVFSYFSRYDVPMGNETHHRLLSELKAREELASFEQSELAVTVNLEIIRLTAEHLPGFRSHNTEHVNRILNMEMVHRCDLVLDIDAIALPWFGTATNGFTP